MLDAEEEQAAEEFFQHSRTGRSQEAEDESLWERIKSRVSEEEDLARIEIKALYRELVKAFHPDKELDESRKEEKNILMKRITEAYEKNDLFTLLKLEAEHLGLPDTAGGKFALYMKELNQKFNALKQEKAMLTKWGPLAPIYQTLYSKKTAVSESKFQAQLQGIRAQVTREESFSEIYSDQEYLRSYIRELLREDQPY